MTVWKYGVETFSLADKWSSKAQAAEIDRLQTRINEWGAEGWEMVSYESVPMYGTVSNKLKGYAYILFFKQPMEELEQVVSQ